MGWQSDVAPTSLYLARRIQFHTELLHYRIYELLWNTFKVPRCLQNLFNQAQHETFKKDCSISGMVIKQLNTLFNYKCNKCISILHVQFSVTMYIQFTILHPNSFVLAELIWVISPLITLIRVSLFWMLFFYSVTIWRKCRTQNKSSKYLCGIKTNFQHSCTKTHWNV